MCYAESFYAYYILVGSVARFYLGNIIYTYKSAENSIMLTYNKLKYKLNALLIKNHLDFADQQTLMCVYCVDSIQLHCKTQIEFIL